MPRDWGDLGIWFAAASALVTGGSFDFQALSAVAGGPSANWMAAGILVAAAAKSAQGPFAAWLFRAMEGPSSVSALLHSSTMVAAGAWLLLRLHEPLSAVAWFGPAAIALGLTTALTGGISAIVQPDAKRLLAASTSAQYGLMFVAVGAGYSAAGLIHLVTHAAFKALLFLAAGTAISLTGSHKLCPYAARQASACHSNGKLDRRLGSGSHPAARRCVEQRTDCYCFGARFSVARGTDNLSQARSVPGMRCVSRRWHTAGERKEIANKVILPSRQEFGC